MPTDATRDRVAAYESDNERSPNTGFFRRSIMAGIERNCSLVKEFAGRRGFGDHPASRGSHYTIIQRGVGSYARPRHSICASSGLCSGPRSRIST